VKRMQTKPRAMIETSRGFINEILVAQE